MVESIGFSATEVLEGILPNAYRKAFETVLIPSYERSCNEMFSQISKEFEKGTRNCECIYIFVSICERYSYKSLWDRKMRIPYFLE